MSYLSVARESVDYTWVIARQFDRCLEAGAKYWSAKYPVRALKEFIGAVWLLYRVAKPLTGRRYELPNYDEVFPKLLRLAKDRMDEAWLRTSEILEEVAIALHTEGLLIKVSSLGYEQ